MQTIIVHDIEEAVNAPAIIFEGGFISNPRDECWYDDPACLFAMAFALRKGVSDYLAS